MVDRRGQSVDPDVIFLSEAFTRPKVMKALAKLGFTQSYSYFVADDQGRLQRIHHRTHLVSHARILSTEFFREYAGHSSCAFNPARRGCSSRVSLAATLSSNYGIYSGFELLEHEPIPGKKEYFDSRSTRSNCATGTSQETSTITSRSPIRSSRQIPHSLPDWTCAFCRSTT